MERCTLLLALGVVGLPIPDETLLVFTGYLIFRGTLTPVGAFPAALAGTWTGISGSYLLGRTLGAGAVHRYGKYIHVTEDRLAYVHRWFDRIGHWTLVPAITSPACGTSRRWWRACRSSNIPPYRLCVDRRGAMGHHVPDFGLFLGRNWLRVAELVHHYIGYGSVAILAAAAGCLWYVLKGIG